MESCTVLEEEIEEGYKPTPEEIMEYALWLGMHLPQEEGLLWIAEDGLQARLPPQWKPCHTEDDEIYYFNFDTGESSWDHPCDEHYRNLYKDEAQKARHHQQVKCEQKGVENILDGRQTSAKASPVTEPDAKSPKSKLSQARSSIEASKLQIEGVQQAEEQEEEVSLQTQLLENIKKDIVLEHDELIEKRQKELIDEVERQIEEEKKRIREERLLLMEQELHREQQAQQAQRERELEARIKQENAADAKLKQELDTKRQQREEKLKSFLAENENSFDAEKRTRLASLTDDIKNRESELIQAEREQMLNRVRAYQESTVRDMKNELLEETINGVGKIAFEEKLDAMMARVRLKVEIEKAKLEKELERSAQLDIARWKYDLLQQKKEESLRQVQEIIEAEKLSELDKIHHGAGCPCAGIGRAGSSTPLGRIIEAGTVPGAVKDALHDIAPETLLWIVGNFTKQSNCNCSSRYHEMEQRISRLESKLHKLKETKKLSKARLEHCSQLHCRGMNTLAPCATSEFSFPPMPLPKYFCACKMVSYYPKHLAGRERSRLELGTDSDVGISHIRSKPKKKRSSKMKKRGDPALYEKRACDSGCRHQSSEASGRGWSSNCTPPPQPAAADVGSIHQQHEHASEGPTRTNTYSSCKSSESSHSCGRRRQGNKLNRLRKGLFVIKGKLLKWSRKSPSRHLQSSGLQKGDVAKVQLELRKKLRQLPVGIRWKVARLVKWSSQNGKQFEGWPHNLQVDPEEVVCSSGSRSSSLA